MRRYPALLGEGDKHPRRCDQQGAAETKGGELSLLTADHPGPEHQERP